MQKIWKYTLVLADYQTKCIPEPATVLSVAEQHGEIVLYALVDSDTSLVVEREIWIFGTGHPVAFNLPPHRNCGQTYSEPRFVGTVKMDDGVLMWHVFVR